MNKKAFSLIELSIVILIIGLIIVGVTQSSIIYSKFKLINAKTLTESSPVSSIKNLKLWYETTLDRSFLADETENNTAISTWYDINHHNPVKDDATQSNASEKPLYIKDAFDGTIPGVRFDGTDDFVSFGGQYLVNSNYTIFVVEQRRSNKTENYYLSGTSGDSANRNLILGYQSNTNHFSAHYSFPVSHAFSGYSTPIARIHTHRLSSTDGRSYWVNGGGTADASNVSHTGHLLELNSPSLGKKYTTVAPRYYNGDLGEVIIYNRALKKEERQEIEGYLSKKYGIIIE